MADLNKSTATLILKLLHRAEDDASSPNEKKMAREKAKELMKKHDVTREDLQQSEFEYREIELPYSSAPGWYRMVSSGLTSFLGCFTVYSTARWEDHATMMISGREQDIQIYEYMLGVIADQINDFCDEWKEERKEKTGRSPSRKQTNAFRCAAAQRVQTRLTQLARQVSDEQREAQETAAEEPETTALVFDESQSKKREKAKEVMSEHTSWQSASKTNWSRGGAGSRAGRKAGDRVRVQQAAKGGSNPNKLAA